MRRDQLVRNKLMQKKTSLPTNYSLTPMVNDALSLASEHIGDQANLSSVQVVKSPAPVRKLSGFGRNKHKSEPMELRFTFSATELASSKLGNSEDILQKIVEHLEEQKEAKPDEKVFEPIKETKVKLIKCSSKRNGTILFCLGSNSHVEPDGQVQDCAILCHDCCGH